MAAEHMKPVSEMKLFTEILKEEFERANADKKAVFKKKMMEKLGVIQKKLQDLLEENTHVTEIEKLGREEFCIDVATQEKIIADGEEKCNMIRQIAEKHNLVLDLLKERVKESTWDRMETQ